MKANGEKLWAIDFFFFLHNIKEGYRSVWEWEKGRVCFQDTQLLQLGYCNVWEWEKGRVLKSTQLLQLGYRSVWEWEMGRVCFRFLVRGVQFF